MDRLNSMNYTNPPMFKIEGMHHRSFYSEIYAHDIGYNIYLPDGYDTSGKCYPVVYHFHGWKGNESSELQAMEKVCRRREAITVFVNHAHVEGDVVKLPIAPMLFDELIPYIENEYRIQTMREGRSVSGFSMGGGIAARLAFGYPEMFSEVTAYAGTYHHYYHKDYSTVGTPVSEASTIYHTMMEEQKFVDGNIIRELSLNANKIRDRVKIVLHIGTDDVLYCDNEILRLHLESLQIPYEYKTFHGANHRLDLIV